MVYDVSDSASFQNVQQWIREIDRNAGETCQKLLIGNKADLSGKRVVSTKEGKEFADSLGIEFLETSAKTSQNVEQAFLSMANKIKSKMMSQPPAPLPPLPTPISLKGQQVKSGRNCC